MGGFGESLGGFLGLGEGPSLTPQTRSKFMGDMATRSTLFTDPSTGPRANKLMREVANGTKSIDQALQEIRGGPDVTNEFLNELAISPLTGSTMATQQVQKNPILGQLFGGKGLLPEEIATERRLQNQGFQLTPQDVEAYGQASGNIARLFGGQEASLAQSLADRGLSSAPSGAAGVGFTGIQGNKNEQLARAQMDIANARMQNTMQRIAQQQQFINSLGGLGAESINQQYGRQLSGVEADRSNTARAAGLDINQMSAGNAADLAAANFKQANKPLNLMDYATTGIGQGTQASLGGAFAGVTGSQSRQQNPYAYNQQSGQYNMGPPAPQQKGGLFGSSGIAGMMGLI